MIDNHQIIGGIHGTDFVNNIELCRKEWISVL